MQADARAARPRFGKSVRALAATVFFLLASAASGSGGTAARAVEIPIFEGGFGMEFFERAAREYSARRPGIGIRLYGDPRISEKLRVRVMEGDFPDATDANLPWNSLVAAGKVLDLTPFLAEPAWGGKQRWADTFLPGALAPWSDARGVWALPFPYVPYAIFYNKRLFREHGWQVPKTEAELLALCEAMKRAGVTPLAFPGVYLFYADMLLNAFHYNRVGAQGCRDFLSLQAGSRAGPGYVGAAAMLQRLARDYFQPGWPGFSHTAAQLYFFQGKTAMIANGAWMVGEMEGKIPPDFELGAFNFPKLTAAQPTAVQVGSGYYFIFAGSPHVRETVDFFKYLTSKASATRFTRERDNPTAIRGVPLSAYSERMRDIGALLESAEATYGAPPGLLPKHPLLEQAYTDSRYELLTGKITPAVFGQRLENAAQEALARAAAPERIETRHPWKALGFVLIAAAIVAASVAGPLRSRIARGKTAAARPAKSPPFDWPALSIFLLPALVLYLVFLIKPSAQAFQWSFLHWDGVTPARFAGLNNFARLLLESDTWWRALGHNLFLMIVPTAFILPLALLFAAVISRGIWGAKLFRVCFFFPHILGSIAVTILWMNAYEPSGGLVNGALTGLGRCLGALGLSTLGAWFQGFSNFAWLSQDHLYWALIPMSIWAACGFNMVLYLAAMEGIDETYYEAATIDGASPFRQFFHVTLPLIREVIVVTLVFSLIGGLKAFEAIWLLTSQQPTSSTHVIGTLMISTLFQNFQVGEATAIAVLLFITVFFGTIALLKLIPKDHPAD